jgi:3-isopropylmalate dehydrogenase
MKTFQNRSARRRRHRPGSHARSHQGFARDGKKFGFKLEITEAPVGWAGIDAAGKALPDATLALCKKSDSILFGSVGLPDRDPTIPKEERPERAALLRLRKEFGLFANLRPVKLPKALGARVSAGEGTAGRRH